MIKERSHFELLIVFENESDLLSDADKYEQFM